MEQHELESVRRESQSHNVEIAATSAEYEMIHVTSRTAPHHDPSLRDVISFAHAWLHSMAAQQCSLHYMSRKQVRTLVHLQSV
jgi:hypothetical protein